MFLGPSLAKVEALSIPTDPQADADRHAGRSNGTDDLKWGEQVALLARSSPLDPYPPGGTATPVPVNVNVPSPGSTKVPLQVISLPARPFFWPKVSVKVSGVPPPSGVKVPVNDVST
jgi:hypothetical protein